MFLSSTIIREMALNLAKVIFTLKHSVVWQHATPPPLPALPATRKAILLLCLILNI